MPRRHQPKPGEQLQLSLPGVRKSRRNSLSGTVLNTYIVAHLHHRGCFAWRQNTGAAIYEHIGKDGKVTRQKVEFAFPGCSDVLGFTPTGRFVAVEGKTENDDIDDDQQRFIDQVNRFGGIGLIVHPDDYQDLIDDALAVPDEKRWRRKAD